MKKVRPKKRSPKRPKKRTKKPVKKRIAKKQTAKKKAIRKKVAKKKLRKKAPKKRPVTVKKPRKKKVVRRVRPQKRRVAKPRKAVRRIKKRAVKKTRRKPKAIRRARQRAKFVAGKPVRKKRKKTRAARQSYSVGGPLERLFESPAKVQAMKLFFRNPEKNFLLKEAAKIMRINLAALRKELKRLEKIGLLRTKRVSPRKELFFINPNFDFFNELRELILKASPVSKDRMLKAIKGLGRIKLVLLSGVFVGNNAARADLLIVGDNINFRKLKTFIKNLEAEAGTDINCVAMSVEEFNYRYDMYDRFVRDLLDEKCEFLVNRLNI